MRSIKVSSRQPLNQFLSIEYFPSFQTLLDKIANFGENSVFRNSENFHIFEKFCLGVNTYKVTSGHPYHTHRVEQDRRNWKKCLFFDTKSALRTFEPPLKKSTLKKLLLDTCTKTAFSFNNQLYEQVDGVSMGGSLGPLLANIIMVELF